MRNASIFHYALFSNGSNGLQCVYFVIMVYKVLLWTDVFSISYIKEYKFYNNNLWVVLGNKQGRTLKIVNPKHEDWASIQLLTLSVLLFLVFFAKANAYINIQKIQNILSNREYIALKRIYDWDVIGTFRYNCYKVN